MVIEREHYRTRYMQEIHTLCYQLNGAQPRQIIVHLPSLGMWHIVISQKCASLSM